MAGVAADRAQVSLNDSSAVLWARSITGKIQRRLVKILLSLGKRERPTKKEKIPQPVAVAAAALRSQHRLHEFGAAGRFWCEDCLQHAPKCAVQCKAWLQQCRPDQQLVSVLAKAADKPQAVQNTRLPAGSALPGLQAGPQMGA